MEHLWSPAGATGGNGWQFGAREDGSDRRKPLRWVATGCRGVRMVRRGSAVRVRQRALQKPRKSRLFSVGATCRSSSVRWVWSRLWSFQVHEPHVITTESAGIRSSRRRGASLGRRSSPAGRAARPVRDRARPAPGCLRRRVRAPASAVERPEQTCERVLDVSVHAFSGQVGVAPFDGFEDAPVLVRLR
jgi:hypothetical protein